MLADERADGLADPDEHQRRGHGVIGQQLHRAGELRSQTVGHAVEFVGDHDQQRLRPDRLEDAPHPMGRQRRLVQLVAGGTDDLLDARSETGKPALFDDLQAVEHALPDGGVAVVLVAGDVRRHNGLPQALDVLMQHAREGGLADSPLAEEHGVAASLGDGVHHRSQLLFAPREQVEPIDGGRRTEHPAKLLIALGLVLVAKPLDVFLDQFVQRLRRRIVGRQTFQPAPDAGDLRLDIVVIGSHRIVAHPDLPSATNYIK